MKIWIAKRSFYLKCKVGSKHGKYGVAIMVVGQTRGHVPKSLSKILKLFLTLPNCVIKSSNVKSLEIAEVNCILGTTNCTK